MSRGIDRFEGAIAAAGFASGHMTVVGMWHDSPLGAFADVMWIHPDGRRVLLAPSPAVRDFVTSVYAFDETRIVPVTGGWNGRDIAVQAGPLYLRLAPRPRDWRSWVFAARPRVLRRSPTWLAFEDRLAPLLARPLLGGAPGVRLAGVTPGGRQEWFSVDDYRPLADGRLKVEGADAGPLVALRPGLGVGLSDFPTRPALVQLATLIEAPAAG
ncbi:hypothetical protein [Egicoccus halophilus]|uniref:Uncharacterized protein n=1 Tax=Egicoccus halophilus TaxID=1670830 RepID=A0A8J3A9T0_9ACTN|nr:hypothetical protein [Egicoccus halophilus]GGI08368.1 hypothetical protein GCM10011354_28740 [Egicoccus halophilus]